MFDRARVHRSFTIIAKSRARDRRFRVANRARAIRAKIRFRRASMRREAGERENFFIAKSHDSESAPGAFSPTSRRSAASRVHRPLNVRLTKIPVVQAIPAILISACGGSTRAICIVVRTLFGVVASCALHALTSRRQHFLKRDAVFFNVLVYSGCSAFRFPSARSD